MTQHCNSLKFKCRCCRKTLFSDKNVANSHNEAMFPPTDDNEGCDRRNIWYLLKELLPTWIKEHIEDGNGTKGALFCPSCLECVGLFDFVSCRKCPCGSHELPPVILIPDKLDYVLKMAEPKIDLQEQLEKAKLISDFEN